MSRHIDCLEQALRGWESMCAVTEALMAVGFAGQGRPLPKKFHGPVGHWSEFRDFLLRYRGERFDHRRFTSDSPVRNAVDGFPSTLAAWNACSRVAYHLTSDLQAMFALTPVENLRWADIPWPFDAFVILLDRPIPNFYGQPCDVLMVNRQINWRLAINGPAPKLEIRFLPQTLENSLQLDRPTMRRWERYRLKENWRVLEEEARPFQERMVREDVQLQVLQCCYEEDQLIDDHPEVFLLGEIDEARVEDQHRNTRSLALRVAMGLSLYLANLPSRSSVVQPEPIVGSRELVRPITSGASICHVLSSFTLSDEELETLESDGRPRPMHDVAPHWVRGHYRRPPGQGQNPAAKKTVWVRPHLVNADRLAPDAQVGGSHVDVE